MPEDGTYAPPTSGYTYDADGNLTSDGTYTYQYDANGHMVKMLQGTSTYATATYNALGWMVNWTLPSSGTSQDLGYLPNGQVEGIFNGNGGLTWWYNQHLWFGGRLLAYYNPNWDTYFIHRDANSSSTQITDQSGGLAGDMLFYPFGQEWQYDNGVNSDWWQFYNSFSRWNASLGFDITPHRKYSPTLGRWMTPDPGGRKVVNLANPQTWNMYAYVTDNPINLDDPGGLQSPGNTGGGNALSGSSTTGDSCSKNRSAHCLKTNSNGQRETGWEKLLSIFYAKHGNGTGVGVKIEMGVELHVVAKKGEETVTTTSGSTTKKVRELEATVKAFNVEFGLGRETTQVIMKNGSPVNAPTKTEYVPGLKLGKFEGSNARLGVGAGGCLLICGEVSAGIQLDQLWNQARDLLGSY